MSCQIIPSDAKEEKIIKAMIEKARSLRFGELRLELKIHNGLITAGEVTHTVEKLG